MYIYIYMNGLFHFIPHNGNRSRHHGQSPAHHCAMHRTAHHQALPSAALEQALPGAALLINTMTMLVQRIQVGRGANCKAPQR